MLWKIIHVIECEHTVKIDGVFKGAQSIDKFFVQVRHIV